jgi:signal transduction histidine kinase
LGKTRKEIAMQQTQQQTQQQTERMNGLGAGLSTAGRRRVETVVETLANLHGQGETLAEVAHDARNMVTALGLYCELLDEPGVLSPQFRHYGNELRLVSAASRRLVEKLIALDADHADAGNVDAGPFGAGHPGAGYSGASRADAGYAGVGPSDARTSDAGHPDAGRLGAGRAVAGRADAGRADAGRTGGANASAAGRADAGRAGNANASAAGRADAGRAGDANASAAGRADAGRSDAGRAGDANASDASTSVASASSAAASYPAYDPFERGRLGAAGQWDLLPAVPIRNLAREVLASRNLLAALAGPAIALTVEAEGGALPVRLSGEDLTRVLVNLVRNAAEAMPRGGRIRIVLSEQTTGGAAGPGKSGPVENLALTIEDNGPGIPAEALEAVFESGYSSHSGHAGQPGNGGHSAKAGQPVIANDTAHAGCAADAKDSAHAKDSAKAGRPGNTGCAADARPSANAGHAGGHPATHRGLGLAISRSIIEAAGGRIHALPRAAAGGNAAGAGPTGASSAGASPTGACFEIVLPVAPR